MYNDGFAANSIPRQAQVADGARTMPASRHLPGGRRTGPQINHVYAEHAPQLHALGYSPVPLAGKEPLITGWPATFCDCRPSLDDLRGRWSNAYRGSTLFDGIGVACHGGLLLIDLDSDDAEHLAKLREIVPKIDDAPTCVGKRGRKVFLRAEDGANRQEWCISSSATGGVLELLAWHRQGVIPPTVHPGTGKAYRWLDEQRTLFNTPLAELPVLTAAQASGLRATFVMEKSKEQQITQATQRLKQQRVERKQAEAEAIRYNGDLRELERYASALQQIDPDPEGMWLMARDALYTYGGPSCLQTRALWDAWSGGGTIFGQTFVGSEKYNRTRTQDQAWAEAAKAPPKGMGAIVSEAQRHGWDARRKMRGLDPLDDRLLQHRIANSDIARAARLVPTGQLFDEAMRALVLHATQNVTHRELRLIPWLTSYVNYEHGVAWPGYERLGENTGLRRGGDNRPGKEANRPVQEGIKAVCLAGYFMRDPNHPAPQADAQGRLLKGIFVPTPPPGFTWASLIAWARIQLGHKEDTASPDLEELYPVQRDASGTIVKLEATSARVREETYRADSATPGRVRVGTYPAEGETVQGTSGDVPHQTSLNRHHEQVGGGSTQPALPNLTAPTLMFAAADINRWLECAWVPELVVDKVKDANEEGTAGSTIARLSMLLSEVHSRGLAETDLASAMARASNSVCYGLAMKSGSNPSAEVVEAAGRSTSPSAYLTKLLDRVAVTLAEDHNMPSAHADAVRKRWAKARTKSDVPSTSGGARPFTPQAYVSAKAGEEIEFDVPF